MASVEHIKTPLQNTINHHNIFLVHLVKLLNHHTTNVEELLLQRLTGGRTGFKNPAKILRVLDDGHFLPCLARTTI
jgi:hypothetical protein